MDTKWLIFETNFELKNICMYRDEVCTLYFFLLFLELVLGTKRKVIHDIKTYRRKQILRSAKLFKNSWVIFPLIMSIRYFNLILKKPEIESFLRIFNYYMHTKFVYLKIFILRIDKRLTDSGLKLARKSTVKTDFKLIA